MKSNVEVLEKLKRRLILELSLEEIQSVYRNVYSQLRNVRMNGFRSGKFPKGWLEKRFKTAMHKEAVDHVLPNYVNQEMIKHEMVLATQVEVMELEFEKNTSLKAIIEFEVKPSLEALDYKKINLKREKPVSVNKTEIETEIQHLLKARGQYFPREQGAKAEDGDWASLKIGLKNSDSENVNEEIRFELGGEEFKGLFKSVKGMKVGDSKIDDVVFSRNEEGKTEKQTYKIQLDGLETLKLPELNEDLFKELQVKNQDELQLRIKENLEKRNLEKVQAGYRTSLQSQLSGIYKEFDLPETLIHKREHELEHELENESKELSKKEITSRKEKGLKAFREDLRFNYIINAIGSHEGIELDRNSAGGEFLKIASMLNQSPEELIKTPFGGRMFNQIAERKFQEAVMERISARVLGDPVEAKDEGANKKS